MSRTKPRAASTKRTETPPEVKSKIVALRGCGFSYPAIANEVGVSSATVKRVCKASGVQKGGVTGEIGRDVLDEVVGRLKSNERLIQEVSKNMLEDLALTSSIREKLQDAVAAIDPRAADATRRLNQAAQAMQATQKVHRTATNAGELGYAMEELPSLTIYEMTSEDVKAMRLAQEEEARELDGLAIQDDEEEGIEYEDGVVVMGG